MTNQPSAVSAVPDRPRPVCETGRDLKHERITMRSNLVCGGCGEKQAVCSHMADDVELYLCSDCCWHSGEEGECYRISDGVRMSTVPDDEL